jgi:hypothetical protein
MAKELRNEFGYDIRFFSLDELDEMKKILAARQNDRNLAEQSERERLQQMSQPQRVKGGLYV